MKKTIKRYSRRVGSLEKLQSSFKKKDQKLIEDFLVFCGGSAGVETIKKYRRQMVKICDIFEGDLDKIDLKRLREFLNLINNSWYLPPTKNEIKKVLKRFLKETYSDWSSRFKQLKDIKGENDINQDKINGDTILTKNEMESLIRGSNSLKYKSLLILFYETAGRPEEILNLKWKNLNLEKGEVRLKSSKTGNVRINPIQESVIHLKRYKQEYPFPNVNTDDWVFPSPVDRTKRQSSVAMSIFVKRLGQKILKRDIFPYLIRHTRLTELQKVLAAKVYEKFADHSIETATRYSHLDKEDVRDAMFKNVYHIEEISDEKKHKLEEEVEKLKEALRLSSESIRLGVEMNRIFIDSEKELLKKSKKSKSLEWRKNSLLKMTKIANQMEGLK